MSGGTIHLDPESVEAVAARVAQLLQAAEGSKILDSPPAHHTLSTTEAAEQFNVSPDYLREHADELQAGRMGDGPRARLRFNPAIVAQHLAPRPDPRTKPVPPTYDARRGSGRNATTKRGGADLGVDLLPVRGQQP